MLHRLPPLVLLLSTALAAACSPPADPSSQAEVADSSHHGVIVSRRPAWPEEDAWVVSAEPLVSVGVLDGPEEYQLVEVVAAARTSEGALVVADRGARTVRLYDAAGAFRRTLGGPGSGPGEFTDPGPVLVGAGDTVTVWDGALLRVSRFGPDGELAGVRTVDWGRVASLVGVGGAGVGEKPGVGAGKEGGGEGLYPGPMIPLPDGSLLVRLVEKSTRVPPPGPHRPRSGALLVSPDLDAVDTLLLFGDREQFVVEAPWGPFGVTPPLARDTRIASRETSPRLCIGDQEGPEIVCIHPEGGRTTVRWVSDPGPVTGTEVEAWREATVLAYDLKLSRQQVLGMLDQIPVPEARPAYSEIFLDPLGNLWVEEGPGDGSPQGRVDFLVFDPGGLLLGRVAVPPLRVLEVGEDYLLGVHRDDLEVEYLHLYTIEKPGPDSG